MIAIVSSEAAGYAAEARRRGIEITHASDVVPDAAEILLADPGAVAGRLGRIVGLRWMQSTWAGVDRLLPGDVPDGVVVTKVTGVFGRQMVEFVFGHLLAHTQHILDRVGDRGWNPVAPEALAGSVVGIVGTGSIGSSLAKAAAAFGLRVIGFNRTGNLVDGFERVEPVGRLAGLAPEIRHLVVALPATPNTAGLIGRDVLSRLEPGATLINVGRGITIELDAVEAALDAGRLGWAVLDVTEPEPLPDDHPLWKHDRCVITSHTAALSRPADIVAVFEDNLTRYRRGEPLMGQVDWNRGY